MSGRALTAEVHEVDGGWVVVKPVDLTPSRYRALVYGVEQPTTEDGRLFQTCVEAAQYASALAIVVEVNYYANTPLGGRIARGVAAMKQN